VLTDILGAVLLLLRLTRFACPLFCLTGVLDFPALLEIATCALLGEFDRDAVVFLGADRDGVAILAAGCCFTLDAVCLTTFLADCFARLSLPLLFSFFAKVWGDIIRNINSQTIIMGVITFFCFLSVNMAKLLSLAVYYRFETPFKNFYKPVRQL
jgi:hypothetical protein